MVFTHPLAIQSRFGAKFRYNNNSSTSVSNCTFKENLAYGDFPGGGGGMFNVGDIPTVDSCLFIRNVAYDDSSGMYMYGGGMANFDCYPKVINCTFSENRASFGGGMHNIDSSPVVTDCSFNKNWVDTWGGGMRNDYSSAPILTNCSFIENESLWIGGGISHESGFLTLIKCHFTGNTSEGGGGISSISSLVATECIFKGNRAVSGGGMCNGHILKVTNCIFIENSADSTGGAIVNGGDFSKEVINCTFSENAADEGGAIFDCYKSVTKVTNSVLWGDIPKEIDSDTGTESVLSYCCIQSGYPGKGNIDSDPRFVDPANDDYHLSRFSPCINRGVNEGAPAEDFDGDPRPYMGSVDMGADEFTGIHTLTAYNFTLSRSAGGLIPFFLQTDIQHGGAWYCLFATMSGTAPGLPLPGGDVTLPINVDGFTEFVITRLNTPYFKNFMSVLSGAGLGYAILEIPPGKIPPGWIGVKMQFAYTVETFDLASNPVEVEIEP